VHSSVMVHCNSPTGQTCIVQCMLQAQWVVTGGASLLATSSVVTSRTTGHSLTRLCWEVGIVVCGYGRTKEDWSNSFSLQLWLSASL